MNKSSSTAGLGSAVISALNGMFGDYLQQRSNGLAIEMAFLEHGQPLLLKPAALRAAHPAAGPRIVVLVHGLCCSEANWNFEGGESYGSLLQEALGMTPFYLRYNTGLPIADNGQRFARQMQALVAAYPLTVEDITLIGHSMGGLVMRHAFDYGIAQGQSWINLVRRAFYLGTPHEGADLAKFAHLAAATLKAVPNPVTHLIGDILNLRSRGVQDLRHGMQVDRKRQGRVVPGWLPQAEHFLISGTLHESPEHILSQLFGDLLVKLGGSGVLLPPENMKLFPGVHHMALAQDAGVYAQIEAWCKDEPRAGAEAGTGAGK